jgi:hypothetical protein
MIVEPKPWRAFLRSALPALFLVFLTARCGSSDTSTTGASAGGNAGNGGHAATGGATSTGSGGVTTGTGDAAGIAGSVTAGGSAGSGGTAGFGGAAGTAGRAGSGGAKDAGNQGGAGGGGSSGAAGTAGSGGASGTSGAAGSSGAAGARDGGGAAGSSGNDASIRDAAVADATSDGAPPSCTPPLLGSKGRNPLFTDQFTADPGALVHDCTFYIQCGHDEAAAGQNGFVMKEWFLLSSKDMVNWTKTVALKLSDFAWADANAWAGQMVAKNGKFYWYVPVNQKGSGMALGVAVADSPTGPFKDAIGKALVDDAFEMTNFGYTQASQTVFTIDPTVLVDDDGQAYLHYGGFSRMVVAKLGADMISISGKMQEVTPQGFFEAPYLLKKGGKYYEIYAAGSNPATIDYATSTSPMGPWTRVGRILDALPAVAGQDAPTNHAGVAEFAGQWYIVYHLSNGPNGGGTYQTYVQRRWDHRQSDAEQRAHVLAISG